MTKEEWERFVAFWNEPENYIGYTIAGIFLLWLFCVFGISAFWFLWLPLIMLVTMSIIAFSALIIIAKFWG